MRVFLGVLMTMLVGSAVADQFGGQKRATVDVDAQGRVVAVELVDALPVTMADAMRSEIATWLFTPALRDEQPVPSRTHLIYSLRASPGSEGQYALEIVGVSNGPRLVTSGGVRYPPAALHRSIEGTVYLRVVITADGDVSDIEHVSDNKVHSSLVNAASKAVEGWRFLPEQVDGVPVAGRAVVPISFCIARNGDRCAPILHRVAGVPVRSDSDPVALKRAITLKTDVEGRLLAAP